MPVPRTNNRVNDMNNAGGGPMEWFRSLPLVTQYWFGATLMLTVAGNMGIISPMHLVFIWDNIKSKFEIWRLLTCFCYAGPFAFPTLILLYLLYNFSNMYETSTPFNTGAGGGTADYVFMWMLGAVVMVSTQPLVAMVLPVSNFLYTSNMVYYVLYVWSKRHPNTSVSIWGFPVKGIMLPFAYVLLAIFTGAPYFEMIHGIFIGHIYYFLVDIVPTVYGKDFLHTPRFLIDQLGVGIYTPANDPQPTAPVEGSGGGGRANWGSGGQRLGGSSSGETSAGGSSAPATNNSQQRPQQERRGFSWGSGQRLGSD
eukprot:CAMPEP_0194203004 /NCGR_PEP_ID=MMETSP0156-20130528/2902_1 /TAXON_ID=33649 /ORGANISM="Thalassionema nitzschioides, Strain L26-B" /LENGTH=310 /DNA_ID=CAMNT_0038928653 /DNA_START=24 /DNA_END=956 /DNA_ORIENTATION=-